MKDRSPEHAENTVSLSDCAVPADISVLKTLLLGALSRHMGVDIIDAGLQPDEQRMSKELSMNKYASDRWNLLGDVE